MWTFSNLHPPPAPAPLRTNAFLSIHSVVESVSLPPTQKFRTPNLFITSSSHPSMMMLGRDSAFGASALGVEILTQLHDDVRESFGVRNFCVGGRDTDSTTLVIERKKEI